MSNVHLICWCHDNGFNQISHKIPPFNWWDSTWFFPFSIRRLVTLPKGNPKEMTSASVTSLGSLRTWITREGTPALLLSPLNFLLSFPLAEKNEQALLVVTVPIDLRQGIRLPLCLALCLPHSVSNSPNYREIPCSKATQIRHMVLLIFSKWAKWHSSNGITS